MHRVAIRIVICIFPPRGDYVAAVIIWLENAVAAQRLRPTAMF
jgi:hypothetical protein